MIGRVVYAALLVAVLLVWADRTRSRYLHQSKHSGRRHVNVPRPRRDCTGRACLVDTVAAWWAVDVR